MAEYAVANGIACYDCGRARCECEAIEADWVAAQREVHRTARLMAAIDLAEAKIEALFDVCEFHPEIPETKERLNNLTGALLRHRRNLRGF